MKGWQAVGILLIVAGGMHLLRLSNPSQVIFDEVHFGKFVTAYCCTHERFFDIHPPHAKLLISGAAYLLGYRGGLDFDSIGEDYGAAAPFQLRFLPALMGILLPLVFYGLLRQLGVSRAVAFFGGLATTLDNALVVQTRLIALDGLLLLATFGAVWAYLWAQKKQSWWLYVLTGVLAGLAVGTKFTGLAALVLLGALIIFNFQVSIFKRVLQALVILLCAFVVYVAGWWLHFALLTQPGSGDVWGLPTGHFWQDVVKLHQQMLSANYNLTATHPDESPWWSWPLMLTSVFYWSGNSAVIYFLGNPVVWWGTTILFIWAFLFSRREAWRKGWIPFAGFLIALLPLTRVPRALFLYHYLTPLLFALAFGLVWADQVMRKKKKETRKQVLVLGAMAVTAGFVLFSPLTYGFQVSPAWLTALWWLPNWR